MKVLQNERIRLRGLIDKDAEYIFALRSNPEINRYLDRTPQKKMEEAYSFIEKIKKNTENEATYYWAITIKASDQFAGTICLWNVSEDKKKAEIGYELLPAFQEKGIMKEAVKLVLDYAFNELKMTIIEAETHQDNISSTKLLTAFDFELAKHTVPTLIYRKTT